MARTYTWSVKNLSKTNTNTLSDVVVTVNWVCTAEEDGLVSTFEGATPFNADEINPQSFVDFNSLTEQTVVGWVTAFVDARPRFKERLETMFTEQFAKMRRPVTIVGKNKLPWNANNN